MNISESILESIRIKESILRNSELLPLVEKVIEIWVTAIQRGNKILFCGNGGSAADAQHLAAELSNKFYMDRKPIYAEALHCNSSYITAAANDYDYSIVYSRLIEAIANNGDVLIVLTTSGRSSNILKALVTARSKDVITIAFTGSHNHLDSYCDIVIKIPSSDVARIQETYMLLGHIICENVEFTLFTNL